jgi:hypothetical protein
MLAIAAATLLTVSLVTAIIGYRRARDLEEPVFVWRREWASAAEAVSALASATGLTRERAPEHWRWLRTFLLAPIWLFWGPMTSMRSEIRLARWRLVGARPGGRTLRIELPSERAQLSVACETRASLWASARRDGASWPLEEQEGLRFLHPVGDVRWRAGTALIRVAFELGLDRVRVEDGALRAEVELSERGPMPGEYPRLFDALENLAIWIETASNQEPA